MTLDSNAVVVILTTIVIPVATWFIGLCVRGWKAFTILSKLATEFQPNGGSSLKDRIEAIYDEIKELSATNAVSLNLVPYAFFRADVSGNVTWINRYFVQIGRAHV